MQAFLGKQYVKDFYIKRVHDHFLNDEIVQGYYWENGRGCGVGCTIHGDDHFKYETELGIPVWLAKLEDKIFEGLESNEAKKWPETFLSAINVGSDLEQIKLPFLIFIVESAREKFDHKKYPEHLKKIDTTLNNLKMNKPADAAYVDDAAYAADDAAAYAAHAAYAADYAAAAAAAAGFLRKSKNYRNEMKKFANKLLELLRDAK